MREKILQEIRRLATANGGKTPGARAFEQVTGIRDSAWRGVYWPRWSEAVIEAGLAPNATTEERRIPDDVMLAQLAEAYRYHGHIPTVAEFQIYGRQNPDFPNFKTIERRFNGFKQLPAHVRAWVVDRPEYADVARLLGVVAASGAEATRQSKTEGSVYLLRSGAFYKIGRSDDLERRVSAPGDRQKVGGESPLQ